ncbi:MAG: ATP-dependent helicase [Verrucomicrobia bacterium]|nr:ATP-dependent helicase [Verrucomicrobiota bacterium]
MSGFTGTLNPQQRQAATHIHGPLLILAGAGTGKTRVVTARVAFMINEGIKAEHILAVTFTNKAAAEMRERVKDMCRDGQGKKVIVGTFHAFCAKLLREFAEHVGYKKNFVIYSAAEQVSLIKRVLKGLLIKEETMDPQKALARISKAKNNGEEVGDPTMDLYAAVAEKYANEMRALNVMDFDDLLCLGVKLLEENGVVRATLHQRHRYVTVDEFQDTNSLQMRLLRALVPAPYNVCVVGDDDQSIYGWRGAEITNITEFENFFPNPTVVKLEENYRSTTAILHTANSLIKHNVGRREKQLWSRNANIDPVRLVVVEDDAEEAEMIAKEIEAGFYNNKEPWESYAVLFRTNDQSRILEQAFRAKKITYRVVGARSFFDRREVKDILSYLTILHNPHPQSEFLRSTDACFRPVDMKTAPDGTLFICDMYRGIIQEGNWTKEGSAVRSFTELICKYASSASAQGTDLVTLTEALIKEVEYMEYLQKMAKKPEEYNAWENGLSLFLTQIANFQENNKTEGLGGFIDSVTLNDEREDKDDIEKKKGVCLITLHASKGLEFPIVYLPGIEQGIMPHKRSFEEGRVDEERRLFYVGITRARQKLTMSFVRFRTKWGQKQSSLPSAFLNELDRTHVDEMDYTMHMKETPSQEENTNFFANLKAMMAKE